jgi:subtilase family serine protease
MRGLWWAAAFAAAVVLGGSASAQVVQQSRGVYHVQACPTPATAGYARCFAHIVTDSHGKPLARPAGANIPPAAFGPSDLLDAYNIPINYTPGTGPVIVIVDAYGYKNAESDLAVYRTQFGLPACTTANGCFLKLNQNGIAKNYPPDDLGWAQETALDLDMVSATCPNCRIVLVQATSNSFTNLATAEDTASRVLPTPQAISNSYGGGEGGSGGYEPSYNHLGIAITVSTGDNGYNSCGGPCFPSTSPHVTAVGGTSLFMAPAGRGWTESAWDGAGSGCSTVYAKPAWQHDKGCKKRTVADVSAVADPATGVAVYAPTVFSSKHIATTPAWLVFGGTSVSAPVIAGIYGENGGATNYGRDPYNHTTKLYDVKTGANGVCGGSYLCTAGKGYDGPTGLGTPNGDNAF